MTARDLLAYQFEETERQLRACFKDLPEAAADLPATTSGMSPRAQVEHLCETYHAFITVSKGGKHEWGTYSIEDKSMPNLVAVWEQLRGEATKLALDSADDVDAAKHASDYIVGHDCYHVGQLVLARMQAEPEWNSYSIYG